MNLSQTIRRIASRLTVGAVTVLLAYLIRGEVPFRFPVMATQRIGGWDAVRKRFLELRATPQLDGISEPLRAVLERVLVAPREARPTAVALRDELRRVRVESPPGQGAEVPDARG